MKTSISDPLIIAEIKLGDHLGKIGVTLCPGKKDPEAMMGAWYRDLDLDLDAIRDWNAAVVVSLIEDHEFGLLEVDHLGEGVLSRHMDWLHLPIRDVSVPGEKFESTWSHAGEGIRARLRDGFNVLIHCRGGMGRAGTIAARLLVEFGVGPEEAIKVVRSARDRAIETMAQENHVRVTRRSEESVPNLDLVSVEDRAIGALVGLAIGDAVGTTLEFSARDDSASRHTDMVGGGPFRLESGEWTDDTSMALALADSLLMHPEFDPNDLLSRFVRWRKDGAYSCNNRCFDIGITTARALDRFLVNGNPIAGSEDRFSAGNGSLMRLAPVAIRYWRDLEARQHIAAMQSRTTHAAPEAVNACIAFADILADAITGVPRSVVLRPRANQFVGEIGAVISGAWRGKSREQIKGSGYVVKSLEAALWCVGRTGNFRDAVLLAANLRDDADTTAAITGQLAGAIYGYSHIPEHWRERVSWSDRIAGVAKELFCLSTNGIR